MHFRNGNNNNNNNNNNSFCKKCLFLLLTEQQLFPKDPSATAPTQNHPPNHPPNHPANQAANQPTALVMNWLPVTLVAAASGSWPAVFVRGKSFCQNDAIFRHVSWKYGDLRSLDSLTQFSDMFPGNMAT